MPSPNVPLPTASDSAAAWRMHYPFTSRYVNLGGLRYHYIDEGTGPVLLCVHGNPTWSFYWRHFAAALADRYRVIAVDHIGCGLSGKPLDYPYTLARHIENLTRFVDQLDLRQVTLAVHDWGGPIGFGTLLDRRARFDKAIVFNTGLFRDQQIPLRIAACRIPYLGALAIRGGNAFALAATYMATEKPERMTPAVRAGYLAPYDSWDHRIATLRFVEDIPLSPRHPTFLRLADLENRLRSLHDLPVQAIWGMRDWCFSPHFLERLTNEFLPQAEVHKFADAGHYVVEDAHERIIPLVREFIDRPRVKATASGAVAAVVQLPAQIPAPPPAVDVSGQPRINIARRLVQTAAAMPEALAVVVPKGRNEHGCRVYERITFRELDRDSDRIARGLRERGVTPGMRLALMVRPGLDFIRLTFGLFKAGAVAILIDPGMGRRSLLKCLDEAEPEGFVALPIVHSIRRWLGRRYASAKLNVTVGANSGGDCVSLVELMGGDWSGPVLADTLASDPAAIIFTTGSTGPPKGVHYRHGNFDAQVDAIRDRYDIRPGEVNLPGFPLFTLFDAAMGVTTIVPDMDPTRPARVDPPKIIEAIHDWQVTQAFGSPAIWRRIGDYCRAHQLKLPSLRRVLSAGAPVPPRVLATMLECLPQDAEMHTPYGATEALPVSSISAAEVLGETAIESALGRGTCVGRRFDSIAWQVIRVHEGPLATLSDCHLLPTGEIGELIVSGPQVTSEYFRRADATALAKIQDGSRIWHRMGDVGYLDSAGRFWFCGRLAHRVVTPTGPMYTIPCEAIFNEHPDIFRSALIGLGPLGEQRPVIIVEPQPGRFPTTRLARQRLFAELRHLAVSHAHTRTIERFLVHRSFPVDIRHNVKIFREKLTVWAGRQGGV